MKKIKLMSILLLSILFISAPVYASDLAENGEGGVEVIDSLNEDEVAFVETESEDATEGFDLEISKEDENNLEDPETIPDNESDSVPLVKDENGVVDESETEKAEETDKEEIKDFEETQSEDMEDNSDSEDVEVLEDNISGKIRKC